MKINSIYLTLTFLLIFFSESIFNDLKAQSIGVSSGVGKLYFFDFEDDPDDLYTNYESGGYQFIRLDLINYLPDAPFLNLAFKFERNSGIIKTAFYRDLFYSQVHPTPYYYLFSEFTIYRMGLTLIPLHLNILKNFSLNVGTELSKTFRTLEKDYSGNLKMLPDGNLAPRENFDSPVQDLVVGFLIELRFGKYKIGKTLELSPIYNVSYSLSPEIDTGFNTKSIRQSLGIALEFELKPKSELRF